MHRQARPCVGEDVLGDAQAGDGARRAGPRARVLARGVGLAARGAQGVEARRGRRERGREQLELALEQRMALSVALVDRAEARDQLAPQPHQAVVGADDPEDDDGGDRGDGALGRRHRVSVAAEPGQLASQVW